MARNTKEPIQPDGESLVQQRVREEEMVTEAHDHRDACESRNGSKQDALAQARCEEQPTTVAQQQEGRRVGSRRWSRPAQPALLATAAAASGKARQVFKA